MMRGVGDFVPVHVRKSRMTRSTAASQIWPQFVAPRVPANDSVDVAGADWRNGDSCRGVANRRALEPIFKPAVKRRPRGAKQDGHALWWCSSSGHDRTLSRPKKAASGHFVFFPPPSSTAPRRRPTAGQIDGLVADVLQPLDGLVEGHPLDIPLLVVRALGLIHVLEHHAPVAGFQPRLAARSLNQERNGLTITSPAQQRGRLPARATGLLVAFGVRLRPTKKCGPERSG